jgi:hypothetical protein
MLRQQNFANVAQSVERIHGKDEVRGSIPRVGSLRKTATRRFLHVSLALLTESVHLVAIFRTSKCQARSCGSLPDCLTRALAHLVKTPRGEFLRFILPVTCCYNTDMIHLPYHLVPVIMTCVIAVQLVLVNNLNLDRWLGMGMGMFSGLHQRDLDVLVVETSDGAKDLTSAMHVWELGFDPARVTRFPNQYTEAWLTGRLIRAGQISENDSVSLRVSGVASFDVATGIVTDKVIYVSQ